MENLKAISEFPTSVSWNNITFSAGDRQILKGMTGSARANRVLQIMGASGAGKTTLCKLIAKRLATDGDRGVTGQTFVNQAPFEDKHRSLLAFVPQDDILNGLSSAEETFNFAARMRRGNFPQEVTDKMVEEALIDLRLDHVRDTVIGIPGLTSGLSGGERKRCNIGAEFVHRPKVLMLDEPTTGLDTVTSERICKILKDLSRKGHTIIGTIHQPTADCLKHFDDIMLLAKGKVAYHGPYDEAVAYFAKQGYKCPRDSTPTDFFMWHLEDEKDSAKLVDAWEKHLASLDKDNLPPSLQAPVKDSNDAESTVKFLDAHFAESEVPYSVQLSELFKRAFRNTMRNTMNIVATLVQAVIFGIFVGVLFNNLTDDPQGVADRMGVLFTMSVNTGFAGASAVINTFPAIKAVFLREQQAGAYSVGAFFIATFLADLPLQILSMIIQVVIVYWSTGLVASAGNFFIFLAVLLVTQQVSVSIGLTLSAAFDPIIAAAVIPTIVTPMMLTGGFLASTDRLRPAWEWLERISFIKMPFTILARNEFFDVTSFTCDVAKYGAAFCSVQPQNGTAVLAQNKLDQDVDQDWVSWLTLALILVLVRFIGWFALYRSAGQKE